MLTVSADHNTLMLVNGMITDYKENAVLNRPRTGRLRSRLFEMDAG